MAAARVRLDKLLVDRGLLTSRERARRLIMAGDVHVDGRRIDKVGHLVAADAAVEIRGDDIPYVSRGGLKLEAALRHWNVHVTGQDALDVGASTGGFTDCLLQHGARHVFAVDVGYGQFAWKLRHDPRVTLYERANIRSFDPTRLAATITIAVIDVSFISLHLVLPALLPILQPGAVVLALVKPQFEVGRENVGKGGVVRDPELHRTCVADLERFAGTLGLHSEGSLQSPLPGAKGNLEFFLHLTLPPAPGKKNEPDVDFLPIAQILDAEIG